MENSEKAKIIISIIKQKVEAASVDYINARAALSSAEMGKSLWEKEEDRQGNIGFSKSPYNVELKEKAVKRTLEEKLAREEVLAYAIDIFLNKL